MPDKSAGTVQFPEDSPEARILRGIEELGDIVQQERKTREEKFEEFGRALAEVREGQERLREQVDLAARPPLYERGEPGDFSLRSWNGDPIRFSTMHGTAEELRALTLARCDDPGEWQKGIPSLVRQLQDANDRVYIARTLIQGAMPPGSTEREVLDRLRSLPQWDQFVEINREIQRALDTQTTGEGAEWVPTGFSAEMQAKVEIAARVTSQFPSFNMPTASFTWPFRAKSPTAQKVSETFDFSSGNPYDSLEGMRALGSSATSNVTFTTRNLRAVEIVSRNLETSAIPVAIEEIMRVIPLAIARGRDDAVINGDTSASHIDSDVVETGTSPKTLWDGLRDHAHAISGTPTVVDLSALTISAWHSLLKSMGVFAVNPGDLVAFVSPAALFALYGLKNAAGSEVLLTQDKLGPNAVLLTGALGQLEGVNIVPTEFVRTDLNASGVYDGTTTSYTEVVVAHRPSWRYGRRPDMGLEVERLSTVAHNLLIMWSHGDFRYLGGSDDTSVACGVKL